MSLNPKEVKIFVSALDYLEEVECDANNCTIPFKCAVPSCPNRFQASKDSLRRYKFHNLPKNPCYRRRWISECGLNPSTNINMLKVCSDHFDSDDYTLIKQEDFGYIRRLRFNAFPKKKVGKNVEEDIVKTNKELKRKYEELLKEQEDLQQQVLEYKTKSRHMLAELEQAVLPVENNSDKDHISKIFSPAQLDILSGKTRVIWTDDDMARAFTLRHMSNKACYMYLKENLNIPLPSLASVQKWAASGNKDES